MKLKVYLGFGSLGSWLSLEGLRRLPGHCELEFAALLGSVGDVTSKPEGKADPMAAYKRRRARARQAFQDAEHQRLCDLAGISAEAGHRQLDSPAAAIGLQWLADRGEPAARILDYAEAVFAAHYRQGRKLASPQAIAALLSQAGAGAQSLALEPDAAPVENRAQLPASDGFAQGFLQDYDSLAKALAAKQDQLLESGILGSPTFILDGEAFWGRAHFPQINWILQGRQGPPPV